MFSTRVVLQAIQFWCGVDGRLAQDGPIRAE